jgi:hypothetical protein
MKKIYVLYRINKPQCEPMRRPHNLTSNPNATYAARVRVCARAYACVFACANVCVRAHTCACVRSRTCVFVRALMCACACAYVCACIVYVRACVYGCVRTCVHVLCLCMCVCVRERVCVRTWCVHAHVKGVKTPFLLVSFFHLERGSASQAICQPWGP